MRPSSCPASRLDGTSRCETVPQSGVSTEATVRVTCGRRIVEQIVDEPAPRILEVIVEVASWTSATANRRANIGCAYCTGYGDNCRGTRIVLQELISERICVRIVVDKLISCKMLSCGLHWRVNRS